MIAGLLLASGASRRFGSNKLVAPLRGRPVVRWSAEALVGAVDESWIVVASRSTEILDALDGLPLHTVENPLAHTGMASSIRAGVAVLAKDAEAVVITLGDQPLIDRAAIRRVVERWRDAPAGIVAVVCEYADGRGHPALFGASLFPALLALEGDRGAKELLASLGDRMEVIAIEGTRPADVDTVDALADLERDAGRIR